MLIVSYHTNRHEGSIIVSCLPGSIEARGSVCITSAEPKLQNNGTDLFLCLNACVESALRA